MKKVSAADYANYADGPPQWLWPFSASSACSFVGHTPKPSGNLVFGSFRSVTIPLSSSSAMIGVRSCSQQMVYHQPTLIFSQFALASSVVMAPNHLSYYFTATDLSARVDGIRGRCIRGFWGIRKEARLINSR